MWNPIYLHIYLLGEQSNLGLLPAVRTAILLHAGFTGKSSDQDRPVLRCRLYNRMSESSYGAQQKA